MSEDQQSKSSLPVTKNGKLILYKGTWYQTFMLPGEKAFEAIRNFPLNDDDIMIVSFPKSGTTWLQQIVWLILHDGDGSDKRPMDQRIKFLEYNPNAVQEIAKDKSPRLLKSHMTYMCLPAAIEAGSGKVLYIARNVKDVCVSYFHFHLMIADYEFDGNFADFHEMFKNGPLSYGPWLDHVSDFWNHRHDANILFLFYEDLHQKPEETIRKVAEFLGRSVTEEQVSDIVRQTMFGAVKDDLSQNYSWFVERGIIDPSKGKFMRKGVIGDWENYYTAEMEADIHQCCIEPLLRRSLQFTDRPQCASSRP